MTTFKKGARLRVNRSVRVPHSLADAMQREGVTTTRLASEVNYSQPSISRMKTGKLPISIATAIELTEKLNSPFLAMDLANRAIQVSSPVITGDGIVKEPLAMVIRSIPEMEQAIEAARDCLDELTTPTAMVKDTRDPMNAIDQFLDVMLYATNAVAFMSEEYGVSMQQKLADRAKEWKRIGIVGD